MTENYAPATQGALVDAAMRLVDDYPGIPAGSVLRCYSRAVTLLRLAQTPSSQLPTRAVVLAARMLAARNRTQALGQQSAGGSWLLAGSA